MTLSAYSILKRAFLQGTVAKLNPRSAHCLPLAASVADVLRLYEMAHVGSVLILDDNENVKGIFTERDLITKYKPSRPLDTIKMPEVMSAPVQSIKASSSIARLLYLMSVGDFRHVPILGKPGEAPRLVSIRDVLEFIYRSVTKMLQNGDELENFDEVVVKNFFAAKVEVLQPVSTPLLEEKAFVSNALALLQGKKVGAVVVTNKTKSAAGIFTERDFVTRVLMKGHELNKTRLSAVMTPDPVCIDLETKISVVFSLMSEGGYRHVPVTSKDGKVTGVVSIKKLFDLLTKSVLEQLEQGAE